MQAAGVSIAAVICAAGSSSRMGGVKKEFLPFPSLSAKKPQPENQLSTGGASVLGAAVSAFASCPEIRFIVIVVTPGEENEAKACLASEHRPLAASASDGRILFVSGGPTRRASVHNALSLLESRQPSHVLIHDGARPWITRKLIERTIEAAIRYGAVIPALPLIETPKELASAKLFSSEPGRKTPEEAAFIGRHLRREALCTAQTPQGFKFPEILRAHEKARDREESEGFEYTDDAEVWGEFIGQVVVIPGDPANKKITYPEDLI